MFVALIASHNQMVEAEQYLHMRIYCMQQLLFPHNVTTVLKCIKHMRTKQDTCQMSLFLCCIAGRRNNISLENILQFVTAMDEEPVLGYAKQPSIAFTEVQSSFLPTANTCINQLNLPRPSYQEALPTNNIAVFELYDYAFINSYFGMA